QLASPDMPDLRTNDSATIALGLSDVPYKKLISWDGSYDDVYLVKLADGSRTKILEKANFGASLSPGAHYILYGDERDDQEWVPGRGAAQKVHLPRRLGEKYQSEPDERPEHESPYGQAGWTDGEQAVLLYPGYDNREVKPEGRARMLPNGHG